MLPSLSNVRCCGRKKRPENRQGKKGEKTYLFPFPREFVGFPSILRSFPFWCPTTKASGLLAGALCDRSGDFGLRFFFLAGEDTFPGDFCGVCSCPLF